VTILTQVEAADVLRLDGVDDTHPNPVLTLVLPAVDDYLKTATGYDWAADVSMDALAKMAATMLTVQWYENPAMIGQLDTLQFGIINLIEQLRAKKLPAV
jgi:hypothetical protein